MATHGKWTGERKEKRIEFIIDGKKSRKGKEK
jgi:hypothetical protein